MDEKEAGMVWQVLEKALGNATAGDYIVSLAAIEDVLAQHPDQCAILHIKGAVLELKALDETGAEVNLLRASLDMKKARICYEKALLLEPGSVIALADMGTHWMHLGDHERARKYYARAIELGEGTSDEIEYDSYLEAVESMIEILEAEGKQELAEIHRGKIPPGVSWVGRMLE